MEWTTIRVSAETKRMLEELRASLMVGNDKAALPLDSAPCRSGQDDTRDRIGLDRVIRRLIADRDRWVARRRKHASKRKASGNQGGAADA